jgi:hypothetical protein
MKQGVAKSLTRSDLLLPDDVVGLFGALFEHLGFDALQDDAGVGAGAFADAGLDVAAVIVGHRTLEELVPAAVAGEVAVLCIQIGHRGGADTPRAQVLWLSVMSP